MCILCYVLLVLVCVCVCVHMFVHVCLSVLDLGGEWAFLRTLVVLELWVLGLTWETTGCALAL
jgi:hypothetical protein